MSKLPWTPSQVLPAGVASVRIPIAPADFRHPVTLAYREKATVSRRSLTAASKQITRTKDGDVLPYSVQSQDWQREAWGFFKIVGEVSYAANLYGTGMSRVEMCLSRKQENGPSLRLSEQKRLTANDKIMKTLWDEITSAQSAEEMRRYAGIMLFVAGEGLLVGLPTPSKPRDRRRAKARMLDYTWCVRSRDDVREDRDGTSVIIDGVTYDRDSIMLIKFWRPDPQFHRLAISSMQASLPVLRELNALTMYVSSIIDSRLAGAGILILPNSATVLGATAPEDDQEEDPTVAAIIEAMVTPIKDRSSAAAVVPLILTVPDEAADAIRHLTFSTQLDLTARDLRDELIRRLAVGFDLPAEQLMGTALAASSHWGAWAISEDTVRLFYMPGVELFARAVLSDLLIPMALEAGMSEDDAESYFFELDGENLISRPNMATEAEALYKLGLLKPGTTVTAAGFELSDMPEEDSEVDRALQMALKICQVTPQLFQEPGLLAVVSQIRAALDGKDASNAPADAVPPAAQPQESEGRPDMPKTAPGERGQVPTTNNPEKPRVNPGTTK